MTSSNECLCMELTNQHKLQLCSADYVFDPCLTVTCQNGGSCIDDIVNGTACVCVDGFTGSECEEDVLSDVDWCENVTCFNGGTCVAFYDDVTISENETETTLADTGTRDVYEFTTACVCSDGYTGRNCEKKLESKKKEPLIPENGVGGGTTKNNNNKTKNISLPLEYCIVLYCEGAT